MSELERGIQAFAVLQLVVVGLSHMFQPRLWTEFFLLLQRQGRVGVLINGFLSLWFGTLVVSLHNVWTGIPLLLTLLGWGQVVKGTVAFLIPSLGQRSLNLVRPDRVGMFRVPGAIFVAMGLLLGFDLAR